MNPAKNTTNNKTTSVPEALHRISDADNNLIYHQTAASEPEYLKVNQA